ncbi:leucine-rich repeat domain-containing protein [Butyricimonas virosa]|uniref:leucine-rich repeat domain-containing protein n=1 Tax=Butyricimonas virosa TaxID=544645 RepID=UPI0032BFF266
MNLNSLINKLKDLFSISIDKEINLDVDISDEKEQPIQSQTIIPDGQPIEKSKDITDIGYKAFSHNTELDSFTIPNHVEIIHSYDFWNCTNLTSIFIHKGVCKIGEGSFSGCTKLTSVTLPDNIIGIGKNAFWNCWQLSSINLPKKLTEIQAGILRNCYNLTSIIIPDNITYIGQNAFSSCI